MASRTDFPGTAPAALTPMVDSSNSNTKPAIDIGCTLAGVIGTQLSDPLAIIQQAISEFERTQTLTPAQVKSLKTALASARKVAMQSQQIARLASGQLRQSHERLKLDDLLRGLLFERTKAFKKQGVELYHGLKPVEVIVDAGLLSSLLEVALDWAVSKGRRLVVTLEMKNWPEYGILLIKASDSIASGTPQDEPTDEDTLNWYLLREIARTMGVSVDRVGSSYETSLMIEFPRTVKRLEGITAVEVETGYDSLHSESKPLAGHRLLVITDDDDLRHEIEAIGRSLGLMSSFTTTIALGIRFCERDVPHMVIIDERVRNHLFDELRKDLRRTEPNFPFIEIASAANTLEMAGWMSDSMTRVSRDGLRTQLASIMVMELAKVM